MKRDCDPLTLPTMMLPNVVGDDTVVGGGPLSTVSSAAYAAAGSSSAANAPDDKRRRDNRRVTRDVCFEPANFRSRIAPPTHALARGKSARRNQASRPSPQLSFPARQC